MRSGTVMLVLAVMQSACASDSLAPPAVEPPPDTSSFQIQLQPPVLLVQPGVVAMTVLTVVREPGFTAPVSVSAADAPAGMSIGIEQGGNADTHIIRVTADSTVPAGPHEIVLVGTAPNRPPRTRALPVAVPPRATIDDCIGSYVLLAAQDDDSPWTQFAQPANIDWPSGRGGLALVRAFTVNTGTEIVPGFNTYIWYGTRAELLAALQCQPTVRGSVAGNVVNGGGDIKVALQLSATRLGLASSFALPAWSDTGDIVAWNLSGMYQQADRYIIRRAVNLTAGGTMPVFDFSSSEARSFVPRQLTIPNEDIEEVVMQFRTANGTVAPLMCYSFAYNYDFCSVPSPNQYPGIAEPREGDAHRLSVRAADRFQMTCLKHATDHALTLPPALTGVELSTVTTTPRPRYRVRYTRQREYNGGVHITFTNLRSSVAMERTVDLYVSGNYLGAAAIADVSMPALETMAGWKAEWGLLPNPAFAFEARGWTETASVPGGAACGQEWLPMYWPERPNAAQLRAAWLSRIAQ